VEAITNDAVLCADSVEVDRIEPWPDDVVECVCQDLVVHSSGPSTLGCTSQVHKVLAPGFQGAVDPRVTGLGLPGSPGSPSLSINWLPPGSLILLCFCFYCALPRALLMCLGLRRR
jgi:hypothetical protein